MVGFSDYKTIQIFNGMGSLNYGATRRLKTHRYLVTEEHTTIIKLTYDRTSEAQFSHPFAGLNIAKH